MYPYLKEGSIVLASNVLSVRKGSIIIFKHQGIHKIKRVDKLKNKSLFVTGINQAESTDSRDFGWIDMATIQAVVFYPHISNK